MIELAEKIKQKGQISTAELPEPLRTAEELAQDVGQHVVTRALAYRAAGNALQLLNQFQPACRTLHARVGMLTASSLIRVR